MILETANSELIVAVSYNQKVRGTPIEVVELKGGKAFVLSCNAMAIYRASSLIDDPLGQGLIASIDIPADHHLPTSGPWIKTYKAGYIRLTNKQAILITPKSFRLYPDAQAALNNQELICELIHTRDNTG